MIKDMETECKTKFSITVEFSFSFKHSDVKSSIILPYLPAESIILTTYVENLKGEHMETYGKR